MTKPELSRYVSPEVSDARLERQYSAITTAVQRPSKSARVWVSLLTAAVVVGAFVFFARAKAPPGREAPRSELATLETGSEGQALTLADGSHVEAAANTRLILAEISQEVIRIGLEHGAVECDVTHVAGREFFVVAGDYEVRVVGTHFRVTRSISEVRVEVSRGAVEIRRSGDAPRRVAAGETWNTGLASPASSAAATAPEPAPNVPSASSETKPVALETAKQLFDRAQRARAAGRVAEARDAFQELRSRYPKDARASLATFELARIELDQKGDAKQATQLLDSTIENTPAGPLREDAEARRIEALERSGDRSACYAARSAFLARYPKSIHRSRVVHACPKP